MSKRVEYTLDESGKIVTVTIDGKSAKPAHMRGLKKAQSVTYWKLYDEGGIATNPFSGQEVELTAFELSIYNWC